MRNLDIITYMMYNALRVHAAIHGKALIEDGRLETMVDGTAKISVSTVTGYLNDVLPDFSLEETPQILADRPVIFSTLNYVNFDIVYYCPELVYNLMKGADQECIEVDHRIPKCTMYRLTYTTCSGYVFIYTGSSVPNICLVSSDLRSELLQVVKCSEEHRRCFCSVNKDGTATIDCASGGGWVLPKDVNNKLLTKSLYEEYKQLPLSTASKTGTAISSSAATQDNVQDDKVHIREHVKSILMNKGKVMDRYEALIGILSAIDESLPDKVNVMLGAWNKEL